MKRKYFFLILALMSVIYFSVGKPAEIADRIMVNAIGVDVSDSGYTVTMQIFSPEGGGTETSVDPSLANVSLVSGDGKNVSEAVKACLTKLGGNIFIGQNQIIIFGRDVDLSKRTEIFGYFLTSSEGYLNVPCACAENTAAEILGIPVTGSSVSSEKYPQMITSAAENGRCVKTTLMGLVNAVNSSSQTTALPVFSVNANEDTQGENSSQPQDSESEELSQTKLEIKSGAIFKNGTFSREISCEQMGLIGILSGNGKAVNTEIEYSNSDFNETLKVNSYEVTSEIKDGKIVFRLSFKLTPKDSQIGRRLGDSQKYSALAAEIIEKKAVSLANEITDEGCGDLLNCTDLLMRFYPKLYRKYSHNLDILYSAVSFEINCIS